MAHMFSNEHRLWSSSATFQKGIYHLFVLKRQADVDGYAQGVRTYQTLFLLVSTAYLLDFRQSIKKSTHEDPAAELTHRMLRDWSGFPTEHPLSVVSQKAQDDLKRVLRTRNDLIYRPYMRMRTVNQGFYEDCTLQDLLGEMPNSSMIGDLYAEFIDASIRWKAGEARTATDFFLLLLARYEDVRTEDAPQRLPTVGLLSRYAIVLNGVQLGPDLQEYQRKWEERFVSALVSH